MSAQVTLSQSLKDAIEHDYFIPILVSSQTQGKFKSLNLPFGMGKSSLSLWLSYLLHNQDWDAVFDHLYYYPSDVVRALIPMEEDSPKARIPCLVWDDVQATAPAGSLSLGQ